MSPAPDLEVFPDDWHRALAVVAHPDDLEYGAASAVASWTADGKDVGYVLVTDGEAGIADIPPEVTGPLRHDEQVASAAVVGVSQLEFLGHPDGTVVADLALRHDLAKVIRRHRPEVIISINYRDTFGGAVWNHADHRAVGRALIDAARDAANPWVFTDLAADDLPPWDGLRFLAFSGSPAPTHAVDVGEWIDLGIASLREHRTYLEHLSTTDDDNNKDSTSFLRDWAHEAGSSIGVRSAATFEIVPL